MLGRTVLTAAGTKLLSLGDGLGRKKRAKQTQPIWSLPVQNVFRFPQWHEVGMEGNTLNMCRNMPMQGVVCSYRHGWDAESSRSCEPFLSWVVKGRLSTEAHSVVLRRVNLCFQDIMLLQTWMPAFISLTVVRNSAADNFICCYLWWCYGNVEYLALKHSCIDGNNCCEHSTDTPSWLPEQGTLRHTMLLDMQ